MLDREKVMRGLECCCTHIVGMSCRNCPYEIEQREDEGISDCTSVLAYDALALLKEQEETINELQNAYGYLQKQFFEAQDKLLNEQEAEPEIEGGGSTWFYVCSECRGAIDDNDRFCKHCGARLKRTVKRE